MTTQSNAEEHDEPSRLSWGWTSATFITAAFLCWNAHSLYSNAPEIKVEKETFAHRRLSEVDTTHMPPIAQASPLASVLSPLYNDLHEREQLFANTPPEEVKYWFEYAGPLQVCDSVSFLCIHTA